MIDLQVRCNDCFSLYFEPNFRKNYPSVLNRKQAHPKISSESLNLVTHIFQANK